MWSLNHQAEPQLDLAGQRAVLEAAHHRAEHFEVVRVQRVEDGLGQQAVALQGVQEGAELARDLLVARPRRSRCPARAA